VNDFRVLSLSHELESAVSSAESGGTLVRGSPISSDVAVTSALLSRGDDRLANPAASPLSATAAAAGEGVISVNQTDAVFSLVSDGAAAQAIGNSNSLLHRKALGLTNPIAGDLASFDHNPDGDPGDAAF
jgi:hypothetical protein